MRNTKRVVVATLSGVLFGFVCLALASSGPAPLPVPVAWQIVTSRVLMGLAIGISALTFGHWSIHGLVMGLLFSVPLAFGSLMTPAGSDYSGSMMFAMTIAIGMVYGLLIELITSVFFKAKTREPGPREKPAVAPV